MADKPYADPMVERLDVVTGSRTTIAAVLTTEEGRFLRAADLCVRQQSERALTAMRARVEAGRATIYDKPELQRKNLYYWNQARGLVQLSGYDESGSAIDGEVPIPEYQDADGAGGPTTNVLNVFQRIRDKSGNRRSPEKATYILADFGAILEPVAGSVDHGTVRALRDLLIEMKARPVNILCVGPRWPSIPELRDDVEIVDMPLPDRDVARARVEANRATAARSAGREIALADEARENIVTALLGLTEQQIDRVLSRAMRKCGFGEAMIPTIIEQKADLIKASPCLEYIHPVDVSEAGGYRPVLRCLRNATRSRKPRYAALQVALRGALFVGIAGTGKSYWARISGGVRGVPTIRLDMGAAMGGIVGETEQNVGQALKIVEALGDVNLWIDEFEKAVGGMKSSNQTDGGTTARAVGKLMTWMAEQPSAFVIACANDVTDLDPALLRAGRFDEKLFFDLPGEADLDAIVRVHLKKRGLGNGLDVPRIVRAMADKQFVAAEVETVVKQAALRYVEEYEDALEQDPNADETAYVPRTEHFLEETARYAPLSQMNADVIARQREWARLNQFSQASGSVSGKATSAVAPSRKVAMPLLGDDVDTSDMN